MPQTSGNNNRTNDFDNSDSLQDRITYRECVTATLPFNSNNNNKEQQTNPPTQQLSQQDLVLSKVKVHKFAGDCFKNNLMFNGDLESFAKDLICVTELSKSGDVIGRGGTRLDKQEEDGSSNNDKTHVLICATNQASRSR